MTLTRRQVEDVSLQVGCGVGGGNVVQRYVVHARLGLVDVRVASVARLDLLQSVVYCVVW